MNNDNYNGMLTLICACVLAMMVCGMSIILENHQYCDIAYDYSHHINLEAMEATTVIEPKKEVLEIKMPMLSYQRTQEPEETGYVYYDVPLSDELQEYTQDLCLELNVDFPLVLSIMAQESKYGLDSISPKNKDGTKDYGIMQINSCNHDSLGQRLGITDFLDPHQNILAGLTMLADYWYLNDYQTIAMYYNSGPGTGKSNVAKGIWTPYSIEVMETLNLLIERTD
ncbi:MAG: transglycosylase SLT domain-containing protein [Eubacteriales bacterium]